MRSVLYGTLALLAAAVLAMRQPDDLATNTISGRTSQGNAFEIATRTNGSVVGFATLIRTRCSAGDTQHVSWSPGDGAPVPFERRGDRLRVREEWERWSEGYEERGWAVLEGKVADDGRSVTGTIDVEQTFTRGDNWWSTCRAKGVRVDGGGS